MFFWIPHAVDTTLFKPELKEKSKDRNSIVVLFVGRLVEDKGVLELIEAAKNIKSHRRNIEFWFVGRGPLERYLRRLKGLLPIKYLGYIDNKFLPKIYQKADILVLPSKRELFGIVLIEAMSCSLPAIASNLVGSREIITHGYDGFLIQSNPHLNKAAFIKELTEYILQLAENSDLRLKMGQRGRQKAEQLYDVKIVAKKWLEVLKKVSKSK